MKNQKEKVQVIVFSGEDVLQLKLTDIRGGKWQNVSGSVEDDESFLEGARRELTEETGLVHPLYDIQHELHFEDRWHFQVQEKCYLANFQAKPSIKLSDEHVDFRWVKRSILNAEDYAHYTHLEAILKCERFLSF